MLLQVDIKHLLKYRLTADEYIIIQLLYDKKFDEYNQYLSNYSIVEKELLFNRLYKSGLIKDTNQPNEYKPEFIELDNWANVMLAKGDYFDEFLQHYPTTITRPDGTKDYLRTDTNRCRLIYNRITKGNQALHNHIVECLKYEVRLKTSDGSMKYMKRMPKWLASEEWKISEQRMKDDKSEPNIINLGYGNNLA